MEITISKSSLQSAVAIVSKAIASNAAVPILAGVLMTASDGQLTLQATDVTTSIRHTVQAVVEEPGSTVVSGKILANVVKNLPDSAVTISTSGTSCNITCQRAKYRLNTLDPDDFPEFPVVQLEQQVELASDLLADMYKKVGRAVSKDDSRPILKGVQLTVENDCLRLVATDSYRLVVADAPVASTEPFAAVVPGDVLKGVLGMPNLTETVGVAIAANQIAFTFGSTSLVTRRIEGNYPNWRQLLPNSHKVDVTVSAADVKGALKRVSVLAKDNPSVRIDLVDGTMTLQTVSVGDGEATDEVPCANNENMAITLNYHYLQDALDAIDEEVWVELNDSVQPAIIKSYGTVNYLCVLMPVRM